MADAARAIIIENDHMLLMHRSKDNHQYFTLVGGRKNPGESIEDCLKREVLEETGLQVTEYRQVYFEPHTPPYNNQYIFVCKAAPHGGAVLQEWSEEALLNNNMYQDNKHTPMWVPVKSFKSLTFRTPQLHEELTKALKKGFPKDVKQLR